MVKVKDKIRICTDDKDLEIMALFDTGAGGSYINERIAEDIGYEPYHEPRRIPLAVKGKEAEVIGYVLPLDVVIDRYTLPEKETFGVFRDLRVDAIIGLNLIEKYNIILEKDKIRLSEYPPKSFLFYF